MGGSLVRAARGNSECARTISWMPGVGTGAPRTEDMHPSHSRRSSHTEGRWNLRRREPLGVVGRYLTRCATSADLPFYLRNVAARRFARSPSGSEALEPGASVSRLQRVPLLLVQCEGFGRGLDRLVVPSSQLEHLGQSD